jgi:methylmalonyl-CoA mutase N-terminal domain/subunit
MVAESDDNVMPYIIDCVKNDCTLGEISDSFRSVFGEHNPH